MDGDRQPGVPQRGQATPLEQPKTIATMDEVRGALENLTPADHVTLRMIGRSFARSRMGSPKDGDDLLHGAIVKTLEGHRQWNTTIPLVAHLAGTMQSDSGHESARLRRLVSLDTLVGPNEPLANDVSVRIESAAEVDWLLAPFAGDALALDILRLTALGHVASEIRTQLGIDKTAYDTAKKRIRRRAAATLTRGD